MSLQPGRKLGHFEIVEPIGKGGMGEVYKATDTRLDRTVAIKVLPVHLSENSEARERFAREAKAVSNLNHPHICTLHDVGSEDGVDFLVMEHIEGESLAHRLAKGALPLAEALRYGIEVADALDNAHRAGIIHRDLKPGNIMLTSSGAKLLDFGLAKRASSKTADDDDLSATPTEERPMTSDGAVLGTFQYMAPEQAEGREVDARTDIFAFGCVLFEMLTGEKAFRGSSQAALIAAILEHDPARSLTPPSLDHLVGRCLAKQPDERWQSVKDTKHQLEWIRDHGGPQLAVDTRRARPVASLASALVIAAAAAGGTAMWLAGDARPERMSQFVLDPEPAHRFAVENDPNLAISPDGSRIVFAGDVGDRYQLFVRDIDDVEARPLPGTELGHSPFFSPDGEWVGFFDDVDRTIRKVPISGGPPITICEAIESHLGASWGDDDYIVFGAFEAGLGRVPAAGGTPERLLDPNGARHSFPDVLPDGRGVLFTVRQGDESSEPAIAWLRPGESVAQVIVPVGDGVRYSPTGHLLYGKAGRLIARRFDPDKGRIGPTEGVVVPDVVRTIDGPLNSAYADNGTLLFVPGEGMLTAYGRLTWVDRNGGETPVVEEMRGYEQPRLSPNGEEVLVFLDGDLWTHDLKRGTRARVTFEGAGRGAVWSPDGERIAFRRPGVNGLYSLRADGTETTTLLAETSDLAIPIPGAGSATSLLSIRPRT